MDYLPTTSLVRETTDPQPPVQIQQGGATVPESVPQLNSTMVQKKKDTILSFFFMNKSCDNSSMMVSSFYLAQHMPVFLPSKTFNSKFTKN